MQLAGRRRGGLGRLEEALAQDGEGQFAMPPIDNFGQHGTKARGIQGGLFDVKICS
jgi:hypothetical protein